MKNDTHLLIFTAFLFICLNLQSPIHAQVVLDGSMGTHGQLNGPDYDIDADYGQQAGQNLFHSFHSFNINTDETATFSGPNSVRNIISRVTGGGGSWIDGQLRSTIPNADLFLLNPAGIMFGANATLDISGSFHVSTSDYLRLGGNERFFSVPTEGEVLSTDSPAAFGFLDNNIAPITFEGSLIRKEDWNGTPTGLSVPEQKTISVIGGDIEISGTYYQEEVSSTSGFIRDNLLGSLNAPEGRINIASVASKGEVMQTGSDLEISSEKPGNIYADHALINVSGQGSGNIFIRSGSFFLDYSRIEAGIEGSTHGGLTDIQADTMSLTDNTYIFSNTKGSGNGGNIMLRVSESVDISGFSRVAADSAGVEPETGNAGSVTIETKNISLSGGGTISSETYGGGQGGSTTLRVDESVNISGEESKIFAGAYGNDENAGAGGTITIETKKISLSDKARISSDTYYGSGAGGKIFIYGPGQGFAESVEVSNADILSGARNGLYEDTGDSGRVEIKAKDIVFTNGGRIGSESDNTGSRGGDVVITGESVRFSGENENGPSKVYTSAETTKQYAGDAGNIRIEADNILFEESGGITAHTNGPGNAGIIEIKTSTLELNRGSVSSASQSGGKGGNAGTIDIAADKSINLDNHSVITTETAGEKSIDPSGEEKGNAGNISLKTCRLELDNESSVSSESTLDSDNAGDAGTISIDICDSLVIRNNSAITTLAEGGGGGRIYVKSVNQLYLHNSEITSSVSQGVGNGGDVVVGALSPEGIKEGSEFVILNESNISANADFGDGGAIFIITENYIKATDSDVTASSRRGNDGTVTIMAPDQDISSSLILLPEKYLDAARWLNKPCAARSPGKMSRFVMGGRDAMLNSVYDLRSGLTFWFEDKEESGD